MYPSNTLRAQHPAREQDQLVRGNRILSLRWPLNECRVNAKISFFGQHEDVRVRQEHALGGLVWLERRLQIASKHTWNVLRHVGWIHGLIQACGFFGVFCWFSGHALLQACTGVKKKTHVTGPDTGHIGV